MINNDNNNYNSLFNIDNSHCTHGMSCINNPYYIGDRTQFVSRSSENPPCTGRAARLKHYKKKTLYSSKI